MPDLSELYAGKYFKTEDLKGKPFKGIVTRVSVEKMTDGRAKAVIYFEGRDRGVVLNGTRHDVMCQLAKSKDTDDWIGAEVVVCAGVTSYQGKRTGCIEFRAPAKKTTPAEQKTEIEEALDDALPDFTI